MADENQATATEKFIPSSIAAFNAISEDSAKEVTPRSFGVMATPMGELAKVGVSLADFVLRMIVGAVAILLVMAFISEWRDTTASNKATEHILKILPLAAPVIEDK